MVLVIIVFSQVFPSLRGLWVWVGDDNIACVGGRWGVGVGAYTLWACWCCCLVHGWWGDYSSVLGLVCLVLLGVYKLAGMCEHI